MSFLASLGSSIVQNIPSILAAGSTVAATQMNRRANEKLADKQFDQNMKSWMMQNAYNSPSSQAARLKAAGLNPALAYGGSGQVVGNADAAPALDYSGVMSTPAFGFDSAIQQGLSAAQIESQIHNTDANTQRTMVETLKGIKESRWIDPLNGANLRLQLVQADETTQRIRNEMASLQGLLLDNRGKRINNESAALALQFDKDSYQYRLDSAALNNKAIEKQMYEIDERVKKYPAEIAQLYASAAQLKQAAALSKLQGSLIPFEKASIKQQTKVYKQNVEYLKAQTGLSEKDLNWYVANHVVDAAKDIAVGVGGVAIGMKGMFSPAPAKIGFR